MSVPIRSQATVTRHSVEVDEDFIHAAVIQELKAQGYAVPKDARIEWSISQGSLLKGCELAWEERS